MRITVSISIGMSISFTGVWQHSFCRPLLDGTNNTSHEGAMRLGRWLDRRGLEAFAESIGGFLAPHSPVGLCGCLLQSLRKPLPLLRLPSEPDTLYTRTQPRSFAHGPETGAGPNEALGYLRRPAVLTCLMGWWRSIVTCAAFPGRKQSRDT